ncbi:hypothetical protein P3X46_019102 [Hevea brasiliensis]|uniref:Retrotransposon gag domain-containing protein n=1 Tax=Hevea brasiliensis TaxID=3981 RepID=A0ABQ9LSV5_HEVBR|nr:hypothetical protein P3X46_019102 [Hevea brasiliensis]
MPMAKTGAQPFQLVTAAQAPRAGQVTVADLAAGLHAVNRVVNTITEYLTTQPQQPVVGSISAPAQDRARFLDSTDFLKLEPKEFTGEDALADPLDFLDDVERCYDTMGCSSARMVMLAGNQLKEVAREWYISKKNGRPEGSILWPEFHSLFLKQFLPPSVQEAKALEFETLK